MRSLQQRLERFLGLGRVDWGAADVMKGRRGSGKFSLTEDENGGMLIG